jgi:hypothetical protein
MKTKTRSKADEETVPEQENKALAVLLLGTWKDEKVISITRERREKGGTWKAVVEE